MHHPVAREILAKLQATHDAFPLQAYDVHGDLIHPQHYQTKLRGSVVRLEFHLNHWFLQERNCFTADISRIRVLVPATQPTPRRRPIPVADTFDVEVIAAAASARAASAVPAVRPPMLRSAFEVGTIYIVIAFLYAMIVPRLSL